MLSKIEVFVTVATDLQVSRNFAIITRTLGVKINISRIPDLEFLRGRSEMSYRCADAVFLERLLDLSRRFLSEFNGKVREGGILIAKVFFFEMP